MFQNIDQERLLVIKQLSEVEKARVELRRQIEETSSKHKVENDKLQQYQEILLKENNSINSTMLEMRQELAFSQEIEKKQQHSIALKNKEIETIKLKISDLNEYKEKYE